MPTTEQHSAATYQDSLYTFKLVTLRGLMQRALSGYLQGVDLFLFLK